MDEGEAHISWTLFGQGGDAVVRFCFDGVFGVSEASNGAKVVANDSEGVTDMVVECFLVIFAAKEVVSIWVH